MIWVPVRSMIASLVTAASKVTGKTEAEIAGTCRMRDLCEIRWAIILVAIRRGGGPSQIARALNRDHTTVISGVQRARGLINRPDFAKLIAKLEAAVPLDQREAA